MLLGVKEHVRRLDVAMDETAAMGEIERLRHLCAELDRPCRYQRAVTQESP